MWLFIEEMVFGQSCYLSAAKSRAFASQAVFFNFDLLLSIYKSELNGLALQAQQGVTFNSTAAFTLAPRKQS